LVRHQTSTRLQMAVMPAARKHAVRLDGIMSKM
jgi:hypothetical protein